MAFVLNKPLKSGKYRGGFTDWRGKQVLFTGTTNREETLRKAYVYEDRHHKIMIGDLPPPKESDNPHSYSEILKEYLDWGKTQGGRCGRPWSKQHHDNRKACLEFWGKELSLKIIEEITLPKVEAVVRILIRKKAPKTVANKAEALRALLLWCKRRGFIDKNPLEYMEGFDTTPKTKRRAMTADEIRRLLERCRPSRRLLYELALSSGLRANEIRSLKISDLDVERCGLRLSAKWTKNRKDGFQPIHVSLVQKLVENSKYKKTNDPLVTISTHPARTFMKDLRRAGIQPNAPGGKLDFHASRNTYITMLFESGTDIKTAQTLARHSTPALTMNVYARARQEKLEEAADLVGQKIGLEQGKTASLMRTGTDNQPVSTSPEHHQPNDRNYNLNKIQVVAGKCVAGSNPVAPIFDDLKNSYKTTTKTRLNHDNINTCNIRENASEDKAPTQPKHKKGLKQGLITSPEHHQKRVKTKVEHIKNTVETPQANEKCRNVKIPHLTPERDSGAAGASGAALPDELARALDIWPTLQEGVKAAFIMALMKGGA